MMAPSGQLGTSAVASALRHWARTRAVPFDVAGYRADIDGLRALAVVAVLLFHADIAPFSGGFVGVDVFFVISGYLITALMAKRISEGRFGLLDFYERRIRRLFPAFFAMLAGVTVASALLLIPADLERFGESLTSTSVFGSNVVFWQRSGYFEGPADFQILLHTWSLAVEEQFYLGLPLVMLFGARFLGGRWLPLLAGCAALSFLFGMWAMVREPGAAFYLAPFRGWELLIGSLLALGAVAPPAGRAAREIAAAAGLALILGSVVLYSEATRFPGFAALLPCAGTALTIWAGTRAGPDDAALPTRWLSLPPIVFVGLISYSLYLWHWPILALGRHYLIDPLTTVETALLLALAGGVATLSWRYVERPFRRSAPGAPRGPLFAGAGGAMAGAALAGLAILWSGGWPQRFDSEVERLSAYAASFSPIIDACAHGELLAADPERCTIGAGEPRIFAWGDSHVAALYGAFERLGAEGLASLNVATPRCPPLLGVGPTRECIQANDRIIDYVRAHPELETVVLVARWPFYLEGRAVHLGPAETNTNLPILHRERPDGSLAREHPAALMSAGLHATVSQLLSMRRKVVLVYSIPATGYDIPSTLARIASRGGDPEAFRIAEEPVLEWEASADSVLEGLGLHADLRRVHPHELLCEDGECDVYRDGHVLYSDNNHLSQEGARLFAPELRRAVFLPAPRFD